MINWHLEKRKLKDLKDHAKNPRQLSENDAAHLTVSLDKFGLIDKPIINTDGTIIGGHQRKKILKKLQVKEVECWVPDRHLEEKEVDELNIRLNKNTGDWDWDILANEWEIKELLDWGFTEEELLDAVQDITTDEEDDSEILEPAKDEDAITKLGDIYELNEHRIVCGDSTLPEYVDKCLNRQIPILMVTDPPYGVEYDPNWRQGKGGKAGKHLRSPGKVQNDDKVNWSLAWYLFPGSIAYVWHAGKYSSLVQKSLEDLDFIIISQIIWAKQNHTLSRGDYHWQHEPCWYAVKKGNQHNWQGSRKESTIWQISSMSAMGANNDQDMRTGHGTQKPIECMVKPIRNNTAIGEGVYDPFLGSGTTLIAAEMLNRTCYGIELSPAYCDIIVQRWKKYMEKNNKPYTIKKNGMKIG
jgi:DNA modification methylase